SMQVLPAFRDLPEPERQAVLARWQQRPDREELVKGFDKDIQTKLLRGDEAEQETVWHAYLLSVFNEWLSTYGQRSDQQAADALSEWLYAASQGQGADSADESALADRGILSLVVRAHLHGRYYAPVVDLTAYGITPLWKYRASPPWG